MDTKKISHAMPKGLRVKGNSRAAGGSGGGGSFVSKLQNIP